MRTFLLGITLILFVIPASAFAGAPDGSDQATAVKDCRALRVSLGAAFKDLYGTNENRANAFGKCVSKWVRTELEGGKNAAEQCKLERNDAGFAAGHGDKTFAEFYGTNKNGKNAFGRCVSAKAKTASQALQQATIAAAKQCKLERNDPGFAAGHGDKTFAAFYGTNKNGKNAFGKCVSGSKRA